MGIGERGFSGWKEKSEQCLVLSRAPVTGTGRQQYLPGTRKIRSGIRSPLLSWRLLNQGKGINVQLAAQEELTFKYRIYFV
jgi:hypothetical protein